MAYRRSSHRLYFENRVKGLLSNCKRAGQLAKTDSEVRAMVYQCAIFQTCAALESYLKLLVESWAQAIRVQGLHAKLPEQTRGFLAAKKFERHFSKYTFAGEEHALSSGITTEYKNWPVLDTNSTLPHYFNGSMLHAETAYPTLKNIKRLFARVGLTSIEVSLAQHLERDIDALIEGFQSVRTALAHSAPPDLTMTDVRRLTKDMTLLASAIDRIFFRHVMRHGGIACWSI